MNRTQAMDKGIAHVSECEDCTSALSRRSMLAGLLGAVGATFITTQGVSIQAAYADAPSYRGDVLVILSLRGGMDGLSTVAPIGDPYYAGLRPTTAIAANQAIKLDNMFGLHPALAGLKPYWDQGQFAVVHGVGSMDTTRSHFSAMEQIEHASPGTSVRTGWLDRVMGLRAVSSTFQDTQVGGYVTPMMSDGSFQEMAIETLASTRLDPSRNATDLKNWTTLIQGMHGGVDTVFSSPINSALAATSAATNASSPAKPSLYPNSALGQALSDVAAMIKSGLGLQVATLDQGDWDHHQNARVSMEVSLANLGACLTAFIKDLGPVWGSVTVVTLSEFGRRAAENGNGGFDHGHGNVMMLASGSGLVGSKVYGTWPTLAPDKLSMGEDLAGTTDYRDVFSEILVNRCGLTNAQVSTAFPGFAATPVGAFKPY